jgi:hypothetical protein
MTDAAPDSSSPRSLSRHLAERFALLAFGLYHIPLFLNNYPSLGGGGFNDTGLAVKWGHVFTAPGIWLARRLFGMTGPMPGADAGDNGDVGEEWARLMLAIAIGVIGTVVWTMADRKQPRAPWVESALRVMLRYSIALGLMSYAIAKILPQQFPPLTAFNLETRVGEITPMRLLWHFMQYSRPYNFFGGLMELTAVVFLCFRRTALLGALTAAAVMTNVALMNWAYDVPVKLYATMLLVSSAVLVLYDAPRLLAMFVKNSPVPAAPLPTLLEGRIPGPVRGAIKLVVVGSVFVSSWVAMSGAGSRRGVASGLDGAWVVTSFARDGKSLDSTGNAARWRRVIVDAGSIAIRYETDSIGRCRRTAPGDTAAVSGSIAFTCSRSRQGDLTWTRTGDVVQLDGTFDGATLSASARHLSNSDYALLRSPFHLIFDR